jgi:glycerol-3-phosphate acyltransferase PlsX
MLKPNLRRIKQRVDHAEHGGGLLLGVAGICIISHGSSQAPSIFNAIRLAKEAIDHQVLERIQSQYVGDSEESVVSGQQVDG